MEKITKQSWEKYDLPENLYELLIEKYNEIKENSQSIPQPGTTSNIVNVPDDDKTQNKIQENLSKRK